MRGESADAPRSVWSRCTAAPRSLVLVAAFLVTSGLGSDFMGIATGQILGVYATASPYNALSTIIVCEVDTGDSARVVCWTDGEPKAATPSWVMPQLLRSGVASIATVATVAMASR